MKTIEINVTGMMCEHCENRVNTAVAQIDGVESVKADAKGNRVTCTFDETKATDKIIKETIEDVGYDVA